MPSSTVDETTKPAEITTALRMRVLYTLAEMRRTDLSAEPTRELAAEVYGFALPIGEGEEPRIFGEVRVDNQVYPVQGYFALGHDPEAAIHAVDICIWHLRAAYLDMGASASASA